MSQSVKQFEREAVELSVKLAVREGPVVKRAEGKKAALEVVTDISTRFNYSAIPRSRDNPELLWIDDPEVIGYLVAVSAPIRGHVVAQEVQDGDAEVLEGGVALVVSGMPMHQPP